MVDNPTAKYEDPQFDPDGIITTENWEDTKEYETCHGAYRIREKESGFL